MGRVLVGKGRLIAATAALIVAAGLVLVPGTVPARAAGAGVTKGDLAVSLLSGYVDEYTPSGTFVQHLLTPSDGLALPTGSAFDGSGNLYVADFAGNRILRRDGLTGAVSVFADDSTLGDGHPFNSPESVVFNKGYTRLYVSDASRSSTSAGIHVVDMSSRADDAFYPLPSSVGSDGAGESDWLAFDANSNLYMTNENPSQGIMRIDENSGDIVQPAFVSNLPAPGYAISFDKNGNLWLGDTNSIIEYDRAGSALQTISNPSFSLIFSAVFNQGGDQFYAGDINAGVVYTYDLGGALINQFTTGSGVSGLSVSGAFVPPNTPSARYVVLGDSIPYGHGLANPTKTTKDGLPPDQGPSTVAYPQLLVSGASAVGGWAAQPGLPGLRALSYRPTSCTLLGTNGAHYDQLAVSGAPAIVNTWTGPDSDCVYPAGTLVPPHKAMFPDETSAANLKADPPALVSIQAGADDINFAGCLAAVLGAPSQLGAYNCTRQRNGRYQLTDRLQTELASLQSGLTATINLIHRDAPHAQIVLLDYYQIIPAPNTRLSGSGLICGKLESSPVGGNYRQSIRAQADAIQGGLDAAIATVAGRFPDVQLVRIDNLFSGHEMCTPDTWVFSGLWDAAHPTQVGQDAIASAILSVCELRQNQCVGR